MISIVIEKGDFQWIDVVNPSEAELQEIAREYKLPRRLVDNSLDPEHLPKAEKTGDFFFLILRTYDDEAAADADSVQEITRKLAVFMGPNRLVTIHRKDQRYLDALKARWIELAPDVSTSSLLQRIFLELLEDALSTFEPSLDRDIVTLEEFEYRSFRFQALPTVVEDSYYLKRRASVFKRIIRSTIDTLLRLQSLGDSSIQIPVQNAREVADHLYFKADDLQDSVNSLLNLHISLSSQKSNDVVKLLTVFSVFFLPLSFIAGVYGMNFKWMPELEWALGYPYALALMAITATGIFFWFKKKRLF